MLQTELVTPFVTFLPLVFLFPYKTSPATLEPARSFYFPGWFFAILTFR